MRQAKKLLETTFMSVKEIMGRVGISDKSHFLRDFKRDHGATPAQHRARLARQRMARKGLTNLSGLQVMVVEDDQKTRELIAVMLELSGARATVVGSAGDALSALERSRPDVLVADIRMPDEDGYALIRQVRARGPERGGRIPAVALTAYARAEDRLSALQAGYQM